MRLLLLLCLTAFAVNAKRMRRSTQAEYRMCVPDDLMPYCEEMVKQETKSTANIVCVHARDRMECIDKVKKGLADFGTVDPEDMYVASKIPENEFTIFEEIRTREEPEAEFRYEGVALVHKDLDISSVHDLKGLRSCHTGVGRNVGYKIPLTKLKNMGIIGNLAEPSLSPRENELDAFSKLFSKACIVGDWSPDPAIDAKMKKRFSNLCQLCEHPEKCNYPDNFSGYEGAIRCLVHNGGQIAWTKVIYVRKFFGLPVGVTPGHQTTERAEDYAYFCQDGTKVPITGTPCRWAARPWQGYMTNGAIVKSIDELRRKIENLNAVGYKTHAEWLKKVLEITDKNIAKENKPISPKDYLDKANYTDVIEREYGPPFKTVRICTTSAAEMKKCETFSKAAFTRNIRPRFNCVQEDNCMKTIRDNGADVITLTANQMLHGMEKYNLKPILKEKYHGDGNYAIAVVRKDSKFKSLAELKGHKACMSPYSMGGFYAPLLTLKKLDLLSKPSAQCSAAHALADYFSGGCMPNNERHLDEDVQKKMCGLCANKKCEVEDHILECPIMCLKDGGDVAFLDTNSLSHMKAPALTDYELLCPNGARAALTEYKNCHMMDAAIPPSMVVTSNSKSIEDIEEIQSVFLDASETYAERPDWFKMFGGFNGKHNLLFSDTATGLESLKEDFVPYETKKIMSVEQDFCK